MPKTKEAHSEINLNDPQYYFNRELSWLEFNRRVLHEALDPRNPLLERAKFAAIFGSNLDEFFMVRVAVLKQQVEANVSTLTPDGRTPQQQLDEISQQVHQMVSQLQQFMQQELFSKLEAEGVHILRYVDLTQEQRLHLQHYYEERVFPLLTPLVVDPAHPFPLMSNLSLNLAVVVKDPEDGEQYFVRVKVPSGIPRFIQLPSELQQEGKLSIWTGVWLEEVIMNNLESMFPGMTIQECHLFRITRNADLTVREDEADDLLQEIERNLRRRHFRGSVVRLQIPATISKFVKNTLMEGMKLTEKEVYQTEGMFGVKDLMFFLGMPLPHLKDASFTPVVPRRLRGLEEFSTEDASLEEGVRMDFFSVIRQKDLLVHHPYESFSASVEQFITRAAVDPDVLGIKMTLYRTSGDSPIIKALITAAEHGKQVAALVEIKARFDEESNITWARALETAGVHVVYGVVGLKTHTKIVLVVRQETDRIRRYVHIGTGNYNPKTAKIYTDLGLLSCQEELGADLTDLFNYLTGVSKQKSYRKILVAPVTLRDRMDALVHREMEHARNGKPARICAKMNALIDERIIQTLYRASQAGVKIDLIVRGMCCLRPGLKGISDNIRLLSIVGRYLEHSRIFHFYNDGQEEIYIGSADWMTRNLDRRVEAVTPVEDPDCARELKEILNILLSDNCKAWELQSDGSYVQRQPKTDEPEQSAQQILMERVSHRSGMG